MQLKRRFEAAELVAALKREGFAGVLLATLGWEHKLPEILDLAQAGQAGIED
jgi:hypothetical protein